MTERKFVMPGMLMVLLIPLITLPGCAHHEPTIAHVHVGHALTGAHDTPGKDGYLVIAEKRADEALSHSESARKQHDIESIKADIAKVVHASDSEEDYGVKQAIQASADHLAFAASSADVSENIAIGSKSYIQHIKPVLERCELIAILGSDVAASSSREEVMALSAEITKLVPANIDGDDSDGDGLYGSSPDEYGIKQLREELEALIDREDPAYETVDRWYLFNLIQLPGGEWIYRKWFQSGGSGSYK